MGDFEVRKSRVIEAFYTGGDFRLNGEGTALFTACGGVVKVVDVSSSQEIFSIGEAEESARVSSFALYNEDKSIAIAYSNHIIKLYRLLDAAATLIHQFRTTHAGPVLSILVLDDGETLVTGSSDFTVKIWSLSEKICLHTMTGKSVVSALCFFAPSTLIVGYFEGQIRVYDLAEKTPKPKELNIHASRISSIVKSPESENTAYACSCDETMSSFNLKTLARKSSVTLSEIVESAVYIPHLRQIVTVGARGALRFWDPSKNKCVQEVQIANCDLDGIIFNEAANALVCSTNEQNLLFVDLSTRTIQRQLAGHNDDVLDVCLLNEELNCFAVATNSPQIKLYDLASFSCSLIEGHSENVLSLDKAEWDGGLLASCSKDNSCLFWRLTPHEQQSPPSARRIGIATGHTNSVTSVRFSKQSARPFVVTVSEDTTLKLWDLGPLFEERAADDEIAKLSASSTFVAHSKDVTCVEVSGNDKLCVTGSLDKTAKLWHIDKATMQLGAAGTLSGHRRGIWSIKFSTASQTVATGSGDFTIKIFALSDCSCQMTLEGHSFAILSIEFINNSGQLLSADSSGILKAWDVKSGACQKTVECHGDKIWAIRRLPPTQAALDRLKKRRKKAMASSASVSVESDEHTRFITGGSDGKIVVWEDVTEEHAAEEARVAAERLAQVQTLDNYIRLGKLDEALRLTLTLEHPHQCYKLLMSVLNTDELLVRRLLTDLDEEQLVKLLAFTSQWNTNTRTYAVAQLVLNLVLRTYSLKRLDRVPGFTDVLKALLPYTKRHFDRLCGLQQDAAFLNYALARMETL